MRLTEHTDHALRVLASCAASPERLLTIAEIAVLHGISKSHLMKVVSQLNRMGLVDTIRGRHGGLRLARPPARIRLGDVVRVMEPDLQLVECFDGSGGHCVLTGQCGVQAALHRALSAFFDTLNELTVVDLQAKAVRPPAPSAG
ncbi:Rrf2 family transcriptional regulator [Mitsuaria sp. WAJ17]|uniref:RrF2 family transcriptional regulator n=1 Tax=Mitsuaria sp. WAJ17 TaxID=2761452 RepID=UPI0016008169|nr:Rrf2 family transcriptional regulator [Mitsuaria sp. WAJ17]MBB2485019.1 Rrf2 family transcriptional regulator [Mitsuaria sp. WAJ17]